MPCWTISPTSRHRNATRRLTLDQHQDVIANLAKVSKKLENDAFLSKAPSNVAEDVKAIHARFTEKKQKVQANLDRIKELT